MAHCCYCIGCGGWRSPKGLRNYSLKHIVAAIGICFEDFNFRVHNWLTRAPAMHSEIHASHGCSQPMVEHSMVPMGGLLLGDMPDVMANFPQIAENSRILPSHLSFPSLSSSLWGRLPSRCIGSPSLICVKEEINPDLNKERLIQKRLLQ